MKKHFTDEKTGISYTLQGIIIYLALHYLSKNNTKMRHKRFLKENHCVLYANLMTSGKLAAYLDEVEQQATALFLRQVKELAEQENVTEELKATGQMLWVQKTNNIRNRATEIVIRNYLHCLIESASGRNPCR